MNLSETWSMASSKDIIFRLLNLWAIVISVLGGTLTMRISRALSWMSQGLRTRFLARIACQTVSNKSSCLQSCGSSCLWKVICKCWHPDTRLQSAKVQNLFANCSTSNRVSFAMVLIFPDSVKQSFLDLTTQHWGRSIKNFEGNTPFWPNTPAK